jgi:hypothetical protein
VGNVSATASLFILDLKNKKDEFNFTINRAGNASMYGDLIVEYIQDNKSYKIGEMNGVAYTNIKKEKLQSKLTLKISV